jgi:pseudaminic acid cytidylyltransferase
MVKDREMIVAVIPARGGSRRILKKNIRSFVGKPIIAYSIQAANETGLFDRIIVSTDSDEIAGVARRYGAEVPFARPADISDDHAGTDAVVLHALKWAIAEMGSLDYVCCIYATAPFIRAEFIRQGYERLREGGATSAFAVTSFAYPIFRSLRINEQNRLQMFWPEHFGARSQDLTEAYHDAGQFYWADVRKYLIEKRFFSSDAVPVILPRIFVQDIDTEEDWEIAEKTYRALRMADGPSGEKP